MFWNIREFCEENAPSELAGSFTSRDEEVLREFASALRLWLDQFVAGLPNGARNSE
jgi:hypothetical protein